MQTASKSIKMAAKEAKQRLKSRFWEEYRKEVSSGVKLAKEEGLTASGVEKYFRNKVVRTVRGTKIEDENFYKEVKEMLDAYGKPSDALDRLMDKPYFLSLSYEERERYLFILSEKYLAAIERYERERSIEITLEKNRGAIL